MTGQEQPSIHLRRITQAKEAVLDAKLELRAAVMAAHEAGESWTAISGALSAVRPDPPTRFGESA
jgi:hypothetical protein